MKKIIILLSLFVMLFGCTEKKNKVLYLNSYHEGYPSSDEITKAIVEFFSEKEIDLEIFYMDTKQNATAENIKTKKEEFLKIAKKISPDIIIASDDNAVKHIIAPCFNDTTIPVVFCGVNWSADQYNLSKNNISGMLEVLPLHQSLDIIRQSYPDSKKLTILSENSTSEQNNKSLLDTLFSKMGFDVEYQLVNTFDEWQLAFIEANDSAYVIYLPTNGAIKNWNKEKAEKIVAENIKIPVFTCDDFMMPYSVFGLTKIAAEQGEWAAHTAYEILEGKNIGDISITKNTKSKYWINSKNAKIIDFQLPSGLKEKSQEYTE